MSRSVRSTSPPPSDNGRLTAVPEAPSGAPDHPDFSIENAIGGWISSGAPRRQLVVGIPYYGQGWTGVTGGGTGLFAPAAGPAAGTFAAGTEDFKVLETLPATGYTLYRDRRAGHSWLFDGSTFWTYDDPVQIRQKTAYIRAARLGGAMMWSLDGDDATASLTRAVA